MFPESNFVLVDSIGKKIKVVKEVAQALDLTNVVAHHQRAEQVEGTFDFVVSRAVTRMPVFVDWVKDKIRKGKVDDQVFRGILYLKGGDLTEEMQGVKGSIQEHLLSDYFKESFFETKKVVHWHH
jgi:16S rRNA (guanine527-N7)-methyltransferase